MTKLAELGRVVANEQDLARATRPRDERAVERFVQSVVRPQRRVNRRSAFVVAAGIALAALAVLGVGRWHDAVVSTPHVATPAVGKPLVARDGRVLPLNFPDGSLVLLASGAEAVVHELGGTGVRFEVSRGEARVSVRHQDGTHWLVGAGPYQVRVTGTRFSVAWTPERERFELHLEEGSVVVSASTDAHPAITMVAPESLVIDRGNWQLSPPEAAAVPASAKPAEPPITDVAVEPVSEPSARVAQPPASPSWEELVRAGKYPAAYDEASRRGIARLADTRSSNTLLSLAEVCRFSGHPAEATQVLTRLRARFPASDDAATAAFQLGRFAGDAAAVSWFRTYLKERPSGALAPEASGRLLEALSRSGDRSGAERAAESYLARYPTGQHAAFARQLLGR